MISTVKKEILHQLSDLDKLGPEERINQRIDKFCSMGYSEE
jgi:acetyl-CoA carboxylase carboxyl transferase subunit alpha